MKINKRLKQVGDYISEESIPLDVGCDHAKLSIYLLKERNFPFVYASDNKEGPLNQAKENISFYNLVDRIKLSKKDGLASLEENIDTITITGMGGLTICKIFKENEKSLANIKSIILSPNNFVKEVRETICSLGYYIKEETLVVEKAKTYHILVFAKGKKDYSLKELCLGPILMLKKDKLVKDYYHNKLREVNNVLQKKITEAKRKELELLKKYLEETC